MSFEDIPEDREESYPCPKCDGNLIKLNGIWQCDNCDYNPIFEAIKAERRWQDEKMGSTKP